MNINYIILAHRNPDQLKRLVLKLSTPWTRFYIHIDKSKNITPFEKAVEDISNVQFLKESKRQFGTWGDIGIVVATINAMEAIISENRTGYTILLSGQDYPLRSNEQIYNYLAGNSGTCFISLFPMPHPDWSTGGMDRLNKYKINKSRDRGHFLQLPFFLEKDFFSKETAGKLNFLRKQKKFAEMKMVLKKRRFPEYLEPYGGGQWWALPVQVIKEIIRFTRDYPDYLDYHRYTLLPDEIFFHSILGTAKTESELAPSLTYVNWEREAGPLPVTFTRKDFLELAKAAEEKLFARKFDSNLDNNILDIIDQELLN